MKGWKPEGRKVGGGMSEDRMLEAGKVGNGKAESGKVEGWKV